MSAADVSPALSGSAGVPGQAPLLTIAEFSRRHDLPESTARFYCKRFRRFLPHTGTGKKRRYLPRAMAVFDAIVEEMRRHKKAEAVEDALAARFSEVPVAPAPRDEAVATGAAGPSMATREAAAAAPIPAALALAVGVDQERLLGLMEAQTEALGLIGEALTLLARREDDLTTVRESLDKGLTVLAKLRLEVQNVRALQSDAETTHQEDLEQLRKWLTRLAQAQSQLEARIEGK